MTHYLILESRDPFDSADWITMQNILISLKRSDNEVTLFLLQNGVLTARKGTLFEKHFFKLEAMGINVLADFFALKERGIQNLATGVEQGTLDQLIQLCLTPNTKTIWH